MPAQPWGARFDSVVMLTWSNWRTEPRSNRYHYASRFARNVPVLFVQPDAGPAVEEATEVADLTLVHVGSEYNEQQLEPVRAALAQRGLSRPLIWIYNHHYTGLDRHFGGAPRIYHATEDYFALWGFVDAPAATLYAIRQWRLNQQAEIIRFLRGVDAVVAVTKGVARAYRWVGAFLGPMPLLENGCDYAFWSAPSLPRVPRPKRIAIYQGGINERLDVPLLAGLMDRLPHWEIHFCGAVSPHFGAWQTLLEKPNCRYRGELNPEALRDVLNAADVGVIPFVQDPVFTRQSLPLKAFEYAACGLPVVSIPIRALSRYPQVFQFARTAADFAAAMERLASTREDAAAVQIRRAAARAQDYDLRFAKLGAFLNGLRTGPRRPHAWSRLREWQVLKEADRYKKLREVLEAGGKAGP